MGAALPMQGLHSLDQVINIGIAWACCPFYSLYVKRGCRKKVEALNCNKLNIRNRNLPMSGNIS